MSDVNDGNFYLSRARCNRQTVILDSTSSTTFEGNVQLNGKISQVVVDYGSLLPLQSGSGMGTFQISSDVTRSHSSSIVAYHKPIIGIDLTLSQNEALMVLDVTPGSDVQERGIFPAFLNMFSDGSGGPVLNMEGIPIGKTSWNGMVHGNVRFDFTLSGSSPVPAVGTGVKITIYLE